MVVLHVQKVYYQVKICWLASGTLYISVGTAKRQLNIFAVSQSAAPTSQTVAYEIKTQFVDAQVSSTMSPYPSTSK